LLKFTNLILLAISFIASIVLAEYVVRWSYPQTIAPRYMTDSGFGNRVTAANRAYQHSVPGEYAITINTNNFGGRGSTDYAEQPDSNSFRICILGDSFAFGYGVKDTEVVSYVLEQLLNDDLQATKTYEVLNFGVSGYGQAEQLNLYRNRVINYGCNEVVLFYFDNDLGNNVVSSLYAIDKNGEIIRDKAEYLPGVKIQETIYGLPVFGPILANSHLWSIVRNSASSAMHKSKLKEAGLSGYTEKNDNSIGLAIALLNTIQREVEESGSGFSIFVIPGKNLESNYPFSRMVQYAINTFDGREVVKESDYYKLDSHWRAIGHEKAAEYIYEQYKTRWTME